MIDFILELFQPKEDAMMAWVQFAPAIISGLSAIYGGISEGRKRREMAKEMDKWNAENEAWYNKEYNSDYMQRADVQNVIRQMREASDRNRKLDESKQVITGGTPQQALASQERRNRMMGNLFSNLSAQGARYKDRIQGRYLSRKHGLQGMQYDEMGNAALSANNLMYNGINGLIGTDWAGILSGYKPNNNYRPSKIKTPSTPLLPVTGGVNTQGNFDWSKLPKK